MLTAVVLLQSRADCEKQTAAVEPALQKLTEKLKQDYANVDRICVRPLLARGRPCINENSTCLPAAASAELLGNVEKRGTKNGD
jgi:hypothetical protein